MSGTYEDTAVFSLTANVVPLRDITYLNSMQDLAKHPEYCANTEVGVSVDLLDIRDSITYKIAKLADGNCWMLDNLTLDHTNFSVLNALNKNNTHASSITLYYLRGVTARNPSTDPNGKYAITGVSYWSGGGTPYSIPLVNLDFTDVIPSDTISQAGNYRVGGYYNYCVATAGFYCYGNGRSSGTPSGGPTEDICPKGWRLPTGNT